MAAPAASCSPRSARSASEAEPVCRVCEHVFVRWDSQRVDAEEACTLPGYREPATVRTFDAPEALDTRFYEVRAKSALNRVPKASRMPFRWTINPYRGCTHACAFCESGDTQVLMTDGRTKELAEIRPGDRIYGTVRVDQYRRYVTTEVLDHWSTIKPAYRVVLEDGTEIVCSGDHRFWTARAKWKHVTGREQGRLRRPHLTLNDKLMGMGKFAAGPDHNADYRAGYLCGMIRGDGHIRSHDYVRRDGRSWTHHFFRLALIDLEALRRTRDYLETIDVETQEFLFAAAAGYNEEIRAIRTQKRDNVEAVRSAIRFPRSPGADWQKGFLAGIYDAEGSYGGSRILRISNTDIELIDRTHLYLRKLGFSAAVEGPYGPSRVMYLRIRGGVREHMRFFHTVDPAISRKRSIEDAMIKSDAKLRVVAIEPLGMEMPLYDITTGTGDFISNGVISHNCFARPTHTYLDFNAGRDFDKEIVVKVNVPEVARAELMRPSWKREHVALGTNTDPYQWVEGRYRLMPGIWEAMRDSRTPSSVLTKSPLLLRDIELFKEIHEVAGFAANLSIPTLEEKAWRASEPHTPHPRKRIEAVAELNRAGIPTGVLIAPLMPGINDSPQQVEEILELCGEAGAVNVGGIPLHLRGEVRDIFFEWLRSYRPDLVPRYEQLYARGAYVGREERERIEALLRPGRKSSGTRAMRRSAPEQDPVTMPAPRPPRQPEQTKLF
jgi:DNA repair photolyase